MYFFLFTVCAEVKRAMILKQNDPSILGLAHPFLCFMFASRCLCGVVLVIAEIYQSYVCVCILFEIIFGESFR